MKEDLQCFTLRDFSVCLLNNIKLEVEWILRSANDGADILSRIVDYDDWQVEGIIFSWSRLSGVHNPWTCLRTMRMLISCPVFIIHFGALDRRGSTHFLFHNNWLVPPIFRISRFLNRLAAFGGRGTLVVPTWLSGPFWLLIFTDKGLSPIVSDVYEIPMGTDVF